MLIWKKQVEDENPVESQNFILNLQLFNAHELGAPVVKTSSFLFISLITLIRLSFSASVPFINSNLDNFFPQRTSPFQMVASLLHPKH